MSGVSLDKVKKRIQELHFENENMKEKCQLFEAQINENDKKLEEAKAREADCQKLTNQYENEAFKNERQIEALSKRLEGDADNVTTVTADIKKLQQEILAYEEDKELNESKLRENVALLKSNELKGEQASRKGDALESELTRINKKVEGFETNIDGLEKELSALHNKQKKLSKTIEKLENEDDDKDLIMRRLKEARNEETKRADDSSREVEKLERTLEELEQSISKERQQFIKSQNELKEIMHDIVGDNE